MLSPQFSGTSFSKMLSYYLFLLLSPCIEVENQEFVISNDRKYVFQPREQTDFLQGKRQHNVQIPFTIYVPYFWCCLLNFNYQGLKYNRNINVSGVSMFINTCNWPIYSDLNVSFQSNLHTQKNGENKYVLVKKNLIFRSCLDCLQCT